MARTKAVSFQAPTFSELRRIVGYLVPGPWKTALILGTVIVSASLQWVPPLLLREIIDSALPNQNARLLILLSMLIIVFRLLASLISLVGTYYATVAAHDSMYRLRSIIYERMLGQSLRFFTNTESGEILSRIQSDVSGVHHVATDTAMSLVTNTISVIVTLIVITHLDGTLTIVAIGVLPLFVLPARNLGRLLGSLSKQAQEHLATLMSHLQQILSVNGFLLTRLLDSREHETKRFRERASAVRDVQVRQAMAGRWLLMWVTLFATVGPTLIYLVGGLAVISGRLTLGTVVAFIAYLGALFTPASTLVTLHADLMAAVSLFRRIFEYTDCVPDLQEPIRPHRLENKTGAIRFEHVSMSYDADELVLNDISCEILPGQMVALVGPSGAGKSTLTYLVTRLYDASRGAVTLDGVNVRDLSFDELYRTIGMVTQETTLLNASVAENLRYAMPSATIEELYSACQSAQIHDAILALPDGYFTQLGERGYKLSGGERQRIAIARTLLRSPQIVIFDEATSALDSRTENLIHAALEQLLKGRTSIIIAHRLSTVIRADQILVLDRGRLVQRGTHEELLNAGGLYAKLCHEQFGLMPRLNKFHSQA